MSKTTKKRGVSRKGTHGSLTKAGKSRGQNPVKNWRIDPVTGQKILSQMRKTKKGKPMRGGAPKRAKRKKIARIRNRRRYEIATMCPACSGTGKDGKVRKTPINIGVKKCWQCKTRLIWKGLRPKIKQRGPRA